MLDAIIDLSHWQATVDFTAAKAGGIEAVILKATQGATWIDPRFVKRCAQATHAGLLVGAYHFCDSSPPAAQVAHIMAVAGEIPVLAIDIEPNSVPGGTVTIPQAAEIAARLHTSHGRAPLIYIGRYGPDGRETDLPNSVLSRCPLWLPNYAAHTPALPMGWPTWTFWQYTQTGSVSGVTGACDRSRYAGDLESLQLLWGTL